MRWRGHLLLNSGRVQMVLLHDHTQLAHVELRKPRREFLRRAFLEFNKGMELPNIPFGHASLGELLAKLRQRVLKPFPERRIVARLFGDDLEQARKGLVDHMSPTRSRNSAAEYTSAFTTNFYGLPGAVWFNHKTLLLFPFTSTVNNYTGIYDDLGHAKEEKMVNRQAPVLLDVLRDNRSLVDYIL